MKPREGFKLIAFPSLPCGHLSLKGREGVVCIKKN